jgi:platelet-activating factor acetylhydrolase isoform II
MAMDNKPGSSAPVEQDRGGAVEIQTVPDRTYTASHSLKQLLARPVKYFKNFAPFPRYLRTRRAILNGDRLFDCSAEELNVRNLMGPLTANVYKSALAALPAIVVAWFISWREQIEFNRIGLMPMSSSSWSALLVQSQVVRAIQHVATAFLVPAVPLAVAVVVGWACMHSSDASHERRQRCRRAFLYFDASYGVLPQMFFSVVLILYANHDWVSDQIGEDTYYAFNFLMGLPLVVAGLWPGYVLWFQVPRMLFDMNDYGEPQGLTSAVARPPRPWVKFLAGATVPMFFVVFLVKLALPGYAVPLPLPSGRFAVGRVAYDWIDPARPQEADSKARREIMVYVWYPAAPPNPPVVAPYFPDAKKIDQSAYGEVERVRWGKAWPVIVSGNVSSHAYENAPVASGDLSFPLIIFSPDYWVEPFIYTRQIELLVSRGYIVAAIQHPYPSGASAVADKVIIPAFDEFDWWHRPWQISLEYLEWEDERIDAWAADIRFTLDQMTRLNKAPQQQAPFASRIDLRGVGVLGHAFGGVAAARACELDQRINACLNQDGIMLDGPIHSYADGRAPSQAFMFLHGLSGLDGGFRTEFYRVINDDLRKCRGITYEIEVRDRIHLAFSDRALLQAAGNPREAAILRSEPIIDFYTNAFFDKFLNGAENTLLDREFPKYGGMRIMRYTH